MDKLTQQVMIANIGNASLVTHLWNVLMNEQTAHKATKKANQEEIDGLRERVQGGLPQ